MLQPRGIALNYNYFKSRLSGVMPFIYNEIAVNDWQLNGQGNYVVDIPNTLNLYSIKHFFFVTTDSGSYTGPFGQLYYLPATVTPGTITVSVNNIPTERISFLALPQERISETSILLTPAQFAEVAGDWETTIDVRNTLIQEDYILSLFDTSVEDVNHLPAYYDAAYTHKLLQPGQTPATIPNKSNSPELLLLKANNQPTFITRLSAYYIKE